ncbi:hypothetical protein OQA88_1425 [Cercophora sp. LCS_1]
MVNHFKLIRDGLATAAKETDADTKKALLKVSATAKANAAKEFEENMEAITWENAYDVLKKRDDADKAYMADDISKEDLIKATIQAVHNKAAQKPTS